MSPLILTEIEENKVTFYTDNGVEDTSGRDDILLLEIKNLITSQDDAFRTTIMKQPKLYKIEKRRYLG